MAFVGLGALWLPIVLSAVIVFVASSIIHMVLPYHRSDYQQLPNEDAVAAAMRTAGVKPGIYMLPYCTHAKMKSPEIAEKFKQGPVGIMIIRPNATINLGPYLAKWFGFCLVVGVFAAYLAGRTLAPGTHYLQVFRVVGATSFMAYGVGYLANGIWKGEPWSVVIKEVIDGLVYAMLTAGTFGWLWPK
jgi:hypothetical protein